MKKAEINQLIDFIVNDVEDHAIFFMDIVGNMHEITDVIQGPEKTPVMELSDGRKFDLKTTRPEDFYKCKRILT